MILLAPFATAQVLKRHDDAATPDQNQAKLNAKKPKNYPRAIAVIEFLPGGGARLVPIALWINDRFYDASLYAANPEPMAVQPETLYEATHYGESLGLFTVTTPEQQKGNWVALGKWRPHQAFDEKLAAQAAKQPKAKPADDFDSDRPVLRRAASSGPSPSSGSPSTGGSNSGSSSGNTAPVTSSSGTPPAAESDPNRPTLKKPNESPSTSPAAPGPSSSTQVASAEKPSASATSPDENDPNRPVLRRGKPENQPVSQPTPPSVNPVKMSPKEQASADQLAASTGINLHSFPAVSDAGKFEPRSMLYPMNSQERSSKSEQMSALALAEIQKFVAARHTPALPKNAAITVYDLRGYDLEFTNSPTLVFTAKLAIPGAKPFRGGEFDYFVTVVAREDFNGDPIKIFGSVTDSNHLDAFPRLEIIDAVDADANGRGDLLFRQYSDTGINYSLYRVFPYEMQKIFEGGSGA